MVWKGINEKAKRKIKLNGNFNDDVNFCKIYIYLMRVKQLTHANRYCMYVIVVNYPFCLHQSQ